MRQTIHSELDYRLPITEGLAAFNVLQAKKVPSKLLVFPDENHVRFSCPNYHRVNDKTWYVWLLTIETLAGSGC